MPGSEMAFFACRTTIDITLRLIAKAVGTKKLGTVVVVRKCHIRTDVLAFQGDNVLFGSIFPITGDLSRPQFPAKAGTEDEIEHRLVLHDLSRSHQSGQDNAL